MVEKMRDMCLQHSGVMQFSMEKHSIVRDQMKYLAP